MNKILSLILALLALIMMGVSGSISAKLAYHLGQEAIKGVNPLESNPLKQLDLDSATLANHKKQKFIQEKEILVRVYDFIYHGGVENIPTASENDDEDSFIRLPEEEQTVFPISSSDNGVTMRVQKATKKGGTLLLDLDLTNKSTEKVEFLYDLLDIRDSENNYLTGIADGLPRKIPPDGQVYSGKVRIPISLLDSSEKISLSLTDYPNQEIKLTILDIPVKR